MGILNLTPDSFYDGNSNIDVPYLNKKIHTFKYADMIDVGAESTRPFSDVISVDKEINRLSMFMDMKDNINKPLSIDSYKPEVIKYALDRGFHDNVIDDIISFFENKIDIMKNEFQLKNEQIIIDPGIGFGKTKEDNYLILENVGKFKELGFPVLIGLSRKSFLAVGDDKPEDRKSASLAAQSIAISNGADCIRTHDVEETYKTL